MTSVQLRPFTGAFLPVKKRRILVLSAAMQESDWKTFRALIPQLREGFLKTRNHALIALLSAPGRDETERFWDAHEQMKKDERILRMCLDDTRRSRLFEILCLMHSHGMLTDEHLAQFSPETAERVRDVTRSN